MKKLGWKIKYLSVPFLALSLSGCGPLIDFGPEATTSQIFTLTVPDGVVNIEGGPVLMVDAPNLPGEASGIHIPVSIDVNEVSFYAAAEWSQGAPEMLRRVMREWIANSLKRPVIGSISLDVKADCRLATGFSRFHYRVASGEVELAAVARLIGIQSGALISSQSFRVSMPVGEDNAAGVVSAFDSGVQALSGNMATWLAGVVDGCEGQG